MKNNENKSEVTIDQLENELEKVKNELLKEDCGTIEVPVEIAKLTKEILNISFDYMKNIFTGKTFGLDYKEPNRDQKLLLDSAETCINVFNELLDE